MGQRGPFRRSWSYAAGISEPFRTVSEEKFSEVRTAPVQHRRHSSGVSDRGHNLFGLGRWLSRGYLVRVSMYYLPSAPCGPKDHRSPQIVGSNFLPCAEFALHPLYLHDVGKLRRDVLLHDLEPNDLAFSASRGGAPLPGQPASIRARSEE